MTRLFCVVCLTSQSTGENKIRGDYLVDFAVKKYFHFHLKIESLEQEGMEVPDDLRKTSIGAK